jgi:hypothetical protein
MLNVIMLNVVILNVVMLNAIMLNVVMLNVVMVTVMVPMSYFFRLKEKEKMANIALKRFIKNLFCSSFLFRSGLIARLISGFFFAV